MEILQAIRERCSTRRYLDEPLSEEELRTVLEAARLAPSGSNIRAAKLYVLRDKDRLRALNAAVLAAMKAGHAEGVAPERAAALDAESWCFYYGAPAVIVVTAPRGSYNAYSDTGCLLENAMLQAAALGLGSCWLNNLRRCQTDPGVLALLRRCGVGEDELVTGALALGRSAVPLRPRADGAGNEIIWAD